MARPKVGDLIPIGAIGSAKKGDVLEGKTYSSDEGVDLEGAMPNNGAINRTITTQGGKIIVPEGYHDGRGIVKAQFANLIASNIRKGVNIGNVIGTLKSIDIIESVIYDKSTTIVTQAELGEFLSASLPTERGIAVMASRFRAGSDTEDEGIMQVIIVDNGEIIAEVKPEGNFIYDRWGYLEYERSKLIATGYLSQAYYSGVAVAVLVSF